MGRFEEIYEKCLAEVGEGSTTTVTAETTDIWTDAPSTPEPAPSEETTPDTTTYDPETSTDLDCDFDCDRLFSV